MAEQQLWERVELRGEGELAKIQGLLEDALERRLQEAAPEELTEEDQRELRAASAELIFQLRQFVVFSLDDGATAGSAPAATAVTTATNRTQLTPAGGCASLSLALRSPLLPPLSPPPADAEVAALEAEVTAAAQRVAELRTSMQARLQEQLAAKLAACRPSADLDTAVGGSEGAAAGPQQQEEEGHQGSTAQAPACAGLQEAATGGAVEGEQQGQPMLHHGSMEVDHAAPEGGAAVGAGPEAAAVGAGPEAAAVAAAEGEQQHTEAAAAAPPPAIPLSPQPAELQQRLLAAANRMPALRARLEAATDRLQRVVSAVSADMNRPPPNTVEKAVLGKTPGKPSAAVGLAGAEGTENAEPRVSPLVQKALESGQISTRRRIARDVQPVPFSQPE